MKYLIASIFIIFVSFESNAQIKENLPVTKISKSDLPREAQYIPSAGCLDYMNNAYAFLTELVKREEGECVLSDISLNARSKIYKGKEIINFDSSGEDKSIKVLERLRVNNTGSQRPALGICTFDDPAVLYFICIIWEVGDYSNLKNIYKITSGHQHEGLLFYKAYGRNHDGTETIILFSSMAGLSRCIFWPT